MTQSKLWNGDMDSHTTATSAILATITKESKLELAERLTKSLGLACTAVPTENKLLHLQVTIPTEHDILTATIRPTAEATTVQHLISIIEDVCCAVGLRAFYLDSDPARDNRIKVRPVDATRSYFMPNPQAVADMRYTMDYVGGYAQSVEISTHTNEDEQKTACISVLLCHYDNYLKYRMTMYFKLTRYGRYAVEAGFIFVPILPHSVDAVDETKTRYKIEVAIEGEQ